MDIDANDGSYLGSVDVRDRDGDVGAITIGQSLGASGERGSSDERGLHFDCRY